MPFRLVFRAAFLFPKIVSDLTNMLVSVVHASLLSSPPRRAHTGFGSNARRLPNFTHRAVFHSRQLLQRGCVDRQPRRNDLMINRALSFSAIRLAIAPGYAMRRRR
jgi:hypothetical protein